MFFVQVTMGLYEYFYQKAWPSFLIHTGEAGAGEERRRAIFTIACLIDHSRPVGLIGVARFMEK